MKRIVYTQRVQVVPSYKERRDCVDQQIPRFLYTCGYLPIPVNNIPQQVEQFLTEVVPQGILLTGGNSLQKYGGDAPERDATEHCLLQMALQQGIPLLGICRGMQIVMDFFGTQLIEVDHHVRVYHPVTGSIVRPQVNSYHTQGAKTVSRPLRILGQSDDGVVEAIRHESLQIAGIMWHPERESPFLAEDIKLIKKFFK